MKSTFIPGLIALVLFSASCKKPEVEKPALSIKGKWNVENISAKYYLSNVLAGTYTDAGNGATIDFQNNGMVVLTDPSSTDSFPYTIKPDSKVEFDGDIYEIKNLTATSVTLFLRSEYGAGDYTEISINLKR